MTVKQIRSKRFFLKHAKASAMAVSLVIHCLIVIVAVSFVAVRVITREALQFEVQNSTRPKMTLKKLQLPVDFKKKKVVKPRLRKQILVKPKLNQKVPDIKMPEITGVAGEMGSAGDSGLGDAGSLGFTLPEINIFGLKSKGEKVFLILDCGPSMMADARGSIPAYNIIKSELLSIIDNLPPTTLFNLAVYSKGSTYVLFPRLKSATADHVERARSWLGPLNQFTADMGDRDYGPKTLGPGGTSTQVNLAEPPLRNSSYWLRSALIAMQQQADAVYVLTDGWGSLNYVQEAFEKAKWSPEKMAKFKEAVAKARRMFDEENKQRREKGLPPKVLPSTRSIVKTYVPGTKFPPGAKKKKHYYSPQEVKEGMKAVREKYATNRYEFRNGELKHKDRFSFNVIHFTTRQNNAPIDRFKKLTHGLRGKYVRLEGLDAIRFNASFSPEITGEEPVRLDE